MVTVLASDFALSLLASLSSISHSVEFGYFLPTSKRAYESMPYSEADDDAED